MKISFHLLANYGPARTRQIFEYFVEKPVIISTKQVRAVSFSPPNFGTPYETSKVPRALSSLGAGKNFVTGMIQVKDCAPTITKLKIKFGRDNFVTLLPTDLMKKTSTKKCSARASLFFLVQPIKSLISGVVVVILIS